MTPATTDDTTHDTHDTMTLRGNFTALPTHKYTAVSIKHVPTLRPYEIFSSLNGAKFANCLAILIHELISTLKNRLQKYEIQLKTVKLRIQVSVKDACSQFRIHV